MRDGEGYINIIKFEKLSTLLFQAKRQTSRGNPVQCIQNKKTPRMGHFIDNLVAL